MPLGKKIHFVWVGPPRPDWVDANMMQAARLCPGWDIHLHGESALPSDVLSEAQAKNLHPSSLADLVRLHVLAARGGWYLDADMFLLRPLEEAQRAWCLQEGDAGRVFCSRQDVRRVPLNNAVIACRPGSPAIVRLLEDALAILRQGGCTARTSLGPDLFSAAWKKRPADFVLSDACWWYPADHARAHECYPLALAGELDGLRTIRPETGGQLPYALHLWLHSHGAQICESAMSPPPAGAEATVEYNTPEHTISGVAEGLAALGYRVTRHRKGDRSCIEKPPRPPELAVVWGGVKHGGEIIAAAARRGTRLVLRMENGFFQRSRYHQLDPAGYLHRASWAAEVAGPAPDDGLARLAELFPQGLPLVDSPPPPGKYVLVLGQVSGDTQLLDSEFSHPVILQRTIRDAAKALGIPAYYRPHPSVVDRSTILPPLPGDNVGSYAKRHAAYRGGLKHGLGLEEAVKGARFVVAINSNALVEALTWGVPALAFGPHLGIPAGVIRKTTRATIAQDMQAMMDGWRPEPAKVKNFLAWLAARQWNRDEFAKPETMAAILARAME